MFVHTIAGSVQNGRGDVGDRETTKAPRALIPSVAIQKKTMEVEPDRCVQWNHVEYSTPCHSTSLEPQRPILSVSCIKQKGVKQLQAEVSTQLGILSSHKDLLQRLTVTFTRSENRPTGIRLLSKQPTVTPSTRRLDPNYQCDQMDDGWMDSIATYWLICC